MKCNMFDRILGVVGGKDAYDAPLLEEITWDFVLIRSAKGDNSEEELPIVDPDDPNYEPESVPPLESLSDY